MQDVEEAAKEQNVEAVEATSSAEVANPQEVAEEEVNRILTPSRVNVGKGEESTKETWKIVVDAIRINHKLMMNLFELYKLI